MGSTTDAHYIGLTVLLSVSAVLSLTGDVCIMHKIWKRKKIDKLYHRLILAISISDFVFSLGVLLSPYALPAATGIIVAKGNTATCSASAAFLLGSLLAVTSYCCQLSGYYRLIIRHNYSEETLARRFEKPAHVVTILVVIIFVSVCLALDGFNPDSLDLVCYIEYWPTGCNRDDTVECTRGLYSRQLAFALFPLLVVPLIVSIINTFFVYWTVRQRTRHCSQRASRMNSFIGDQVLRRNKRVGVQAFLYMLAYFNTFFWILSNVIVYEVLLPNPEEMTSGLYAYLCLYNFFVPLQGFLNFFVYIRPRYLQWQESDLDKSRLWALRKALFDKNPPPTMISSRSNISSRSHMRTATLSGSNITSPSHMRDATLSGLKKLGDSSTLFDVEQVEQSKPVERVTEENAGDES